MEGKRGYSVQCTCTVSSFWRKNLRVHPKVTLGFFQGPPSLMNNVNLNIYWYKSAYLLVSSRADSTLCCPFKAIASNGTSLAWCPIEWEVTCLTRITFCLRNIRLISSWAVLWRKNGLMIKCWIVKNILLEAAKLKAASSFWLGFNCYNIFKRLLYYSQILLIRTLRGP